MKSFGTHPSFLELDRIALGVIDRDVAEHARSCPDCRGYLERLGEVPRLPASLRGLAPPPRWRRWFALPTWRPLAFAGAAGALAAVAVVVALPGGPGGPQVAPVHAGSGPAYVAAKGLATVAVWVKHGEEIRLWDGVAALAPGDRVQLEIEPGPDHRWFALVAGDEHTRLAVGELEPERRHLLPRSFVLDGAPGPEELVVLLAPGPLPDHRLDEAAAGAEPGVKAIRLVIPKAAPEEVVP
jgi:hypothetical protein